MRQIDDVADDGMPVSLMLDDGGGDADAGVELLAERGRLMLWLIVRDGRRVIMKGLREELRGHAEEIARLRKEYSIGVRIDHHAVARIYGFEYHPLLGPVIVMEYIDGITLDEYMTDKRPLSDRRRIAFEIADGLASIHAAGLSHRDLKPDNILVTRKGSRAKIIDFGHGDSEDYLIYKASLGTALYGAPEQQQPSVGDSGSDVFTFGKLMEGLLPERRFGRLKKSCCSDEPSARPLMSAVAKRLDPSRHAALRRRIWGWAALAAIPLSGMIGYYLHRQEIENETAGESEIAIAEVSDELPLNDVAEVPVEDSAVRDAAVSETQVADRRSRDAQEKLREGVQTSTGEISVADSLLAVYIAESDRLIERYGSLAYLNYDSAEEKERVGLRKERGDESYVLADRFEAEMIAAGLPRFEVDKLLMTFWLHLTTATNRADGLVH